MNRKGFSLIEVLVSLVLLAVGLLAIAGMQISSARGNFFSNNMTQASILAQDRLEALRNLPFNDDGLSPGRHDDGVIQGTVLTRDYNVSVLPGTTMLSIMVNVSWTDNSNHTVSFTTVRSQ